MFYFLNCSLPGATSQGHCCLQAGTGTISQGAVIFVLMNNKVCACTLKKITFANYVFLSFSMPPRTKGIHCSGPRNEVLETVYDPPVSGGWILGSCCLERVSGGRSAPGTCTFGIQR